MSLSLLGPDWLGWIINTELIRCVFTEAVPLEGLEKLFLKQQHMVGVLLLAGMDLIWNS